MALFATNGMNKLSKQHISKGGRQDRQALAGIDASAAKDYVKWCRDIVRDVTL